MNWGSSLRIVENSSTRLVAVDPPWYLFGSLLLIAALLIGRTAWPVKGAKGGHDQFEWLAIGVAAPMAVLAFGLLTGEGRLSLDRGSGEMQLQASFAGVTWRDIRLPLAQVQQATVQYYRSGQRVTLVLANGKPLAFGLPSQRSGQVEVVSAVNRFLTATSDRDRH